MSVPLPPTGGNCSTMDPEIFFPEIIPRRTDIQVALDACHSCPVLAECAEYTVKINPGWGVWAGQLRSRSWRDIRNDRKREML